MLGVRDADPQPVSWESLGPRQQLSGEWLLGCGTIVPPTASHGLYTDASFAPQSAPVAALFSRPSAIVPSFSFRSIARAPAVVPEPAPAVGKFLAWRGMEVLDPHKMAGVPIIGPGPLRRSPLSCSAPQHYMAGHRFLGLLITYI